MHMLALYDCELESFVNYIQNVKACIMSIKLYIASWLQEFPQIVEW